MNKNCCDKAGSIIDAEFQYCEGKFVMVKVPSCLPGLFTVRFIAPADYTAGDVIVVRGKEFPVRTSTMSTVASDVFKAGAVVHCDIDLDRELAFFWQGGSTGSNGECYSGRRLLTADTTYYLRKDGNDDKDGLSEETAFETWDRMRQELMSVDGAGNRLTIDLGIGTWANSFVLEGRYCVGFSSITLEGQGDKTIISPNSGAGVTAGYGSVHVIVKNVLINGAAIGLCCIFGGVLVIGGTVTLSGVSTAGIQANMGSITISANSVVKFINNISSVSLIMAIHGGLIIVNHQSSILLTGTNSGAQLIYSEWNGKINIAESASISGAFTGRKYSVTSGSLFNCGGKTIPGTVAGFTATNGCVW